MKCVFYVLKNSQGILYKGCTNNMERRLMEHNSTGNTYTKIRGPWKVVYREEFDSKGKAMRKENYYKTVKGRDELHQKIN